MHCIEQEKSHTDRNSKQTAIHCESHSVASLRDLTWVVCTHTPRVHTHVCIPCKCTHVCTYTYIPEISRHSSHFSLCNHCPSPHSSAFHICKAGLHIFTQMYMYGTIPESETHQVGDFRLNPSRPPNLTMYIVKSHTGITYDTLSLQRKRGRVGLRGWWPYRLRENVLWQPIILGAPNRIAQECWKCIQHYDICGLIPKDNLQMNTQDVDFYVPNNFQTP